MLVSPCVDYDDGIGSLESFFRLGIAGGPFEFRQDPASIGRLGSSGA